VFITPRTREELQTSSLNSLLRQEKRVTIKVHFPPKLAALIGQSSTSILLPTNLLTVKELIATLHTKWSVGRASPKWAADDPLKHGFVLKMTGYQDFLLFEDQFVLNYDYVAEQLLQKQLCNLNVVLLTERDATHIAKYLAEFADWHGLSEIQDYSTQDSNVSERPFLLPRVMQNLKLDGPWSSSSGPDSDWRKERFISHARCKWPFRVRVDALQLTSTFLKDNVRDCPRCLQWRAHGDNLVASLTSLGLNLNQHVPLPDIPLQQGLRLHS